MYRTIMNDPSEYLMLSGIQHYCFCKRHWALIHIEQQWKENWRTISGELVHKKVHMDGMNESRTDKIIVRGLRVVSNKLKLSGICDVVEFIRSSSGINLPNRDGFWTLYPVEYKRGIQREDDADRLQLCAEAIALEEMFSTAIEFGFIYHNETRRREKVILNDSLRLKTLDMAMDMVNMFENGITPSPDRKSHCRSCSLVDCCAPKLQSINSTSYIQHMLEDE